MNKRPSRRAAAGIKGLAPRGTPPVRGNLIQVMPVTGGQIKGALAGAGTAANAAIQSASKSLDKKGKDLLGETGTRTFQVDEQTIQRGQPPVAANRRRGNGSPGQSSETRSGSGVEVINGGFGPDA